MSSCVGPVVDVQVSYSVFLREKTLGCHLVESGCTSIGEGLFRPCVLDSCGTIRPTLHLRNGPVVSYCQDTIAALLYTSLSNPSLSTGMLALIPGSLSPFRRLLWQDLITEVEGHELSWAFSLVFNSISAYSDSVLTAEVSQSCFGGILRGVSLSHTDAIPVSNCPSVLSLSPTSVPVGRSTLGRIFNVSGSVIDPFPEVLVGSFYRDRCDRNSLPFSVFFTQMTSSCQPYKVPIPPTFWFTLEDHVLYQASILLLLSLALSKYQCRL